MKACRNNTQIKQSFRTLPIIAAMVAAGVAQPALAVDRTWFGDSGGWGVVSNWSPAGVPGSSDKATIQDGNLTLSLDTEVGGLEFNAGQIGGKGNLFVNGLTSWRGGNFSGTGITQFAGPLSITGVFTKAIDSGRVIDVTDTTWGGNFASNMNAIQLGFGGSAASIIHSSGTWTDANAFDSYMAGDYTGVSSAFENSGTYNKNGNALTIIGAIYNNTGTTNVNAGTLTLGGGGTSTGVFNIATNSTLSFNGGTHTLNNVTTSGAGTLEIRANSIVNINGGNHSTSVLISQEGQLQGANNTFNGPVTWMSGFL
ncbi:MAG: hypothetical protein ABJA60_05320 [Nitrosospira sp.]